MGIVHHIDTSKMIYRANQLTGFYVMDSLILYGLNAGQIQKYDTRTETFYKTLFS